VTQNQPLRGLRVLEFCWVWSGPMIGQHLADLGAEVIKVEWYKRHDLYRTRGVERLRGKMPEQVRRESSYPFQSLNRNKLGLAIDLKHEEGLQIVKDLIAESDLLLENFSVGTLDRLGLGADELKRLNQRLVVVSLSATGRGSTIESLRSYGLMLSALGGFEALIKDDDGAFVGSPTFVMSDPNAALFGTLAALAGTLHARETGAGATYECSQVEAVASLVNTPAPETDAAAGVEGIFATSAGDFVAVTTATDTAGDPAEFAEWAKQQDTASVIEAVRSGGGNATRVNSLGATLTAEEFVDTQVRQPVEHPVSGTRELVATPWWIDGRRPMPSRPAPGLGEHNDEVLRRVLGYDAARITSLHEAGVLDEPES
jgi:crotonobetainyl-CoA:carnitine CoA-transferase CaiB-like acyl-CoA transferase